MEVTLQQAHENKTPARHKIFRAFAELLVAQGYEALTINDVLKRPGVGRTSFYEQFKSKEDLLQQSVECMGAAVLAGTDTEVITPLPFTLAFFQHVGSPQGVYDSIIGRPDFILVEHYVKRMLQRMVIDDLRLHFPQTPTSLREATAHHLVGALLATVRWWKENRGHYSAEEINTIFQQLAHPGLENLMSSK